MILDKIKNRRSVFPNQFSSQSVSREQIEVLLEAANWAPSHRKTEPWRFKIFKDDSLKSLAEIVEKAYTATTPEDKFSVFKLAKSVEKVMTSGAVIVICMQRDSKERLPEWEEIAATSMAVQNLWLAAGDLGLGGYWSSPGYVETLGEDLKLNAGERCLGFFYLGSYDGPQMEGDRDPISDKTIWF